MDFNPELIHRQYYKFYTNRFTQLFEKYVKDFIKEGYSSEKFYNSRQSVERDVRERLKRVYLDENTMSIIDSFRDTSREWNSFEYTRTFNDKSFKIILDNSGLDYKLFIKSHAIFDALYTFQKLSSNCISLVEKLIEIYNNDELKDQVDIDTYDFIRFIDENNKEENKRLDCIISPNKEECNSSANTSDQVIYKFGVGLSKKEIAIYMLFRKGHYKMNISKSELAAESYLIFGDFDNAFLENKDAAATPIYQMLNEDAIFTKDFKYKKAISNIEGFLQTNETKRFTKLIKYIKQQKMEGFKSLCYKK